PGMSNKLKTIFSSYRTSPEKLVCIGISFGILSYKRNVTRTDMIVIIKGIRKSQLDMTILSSRKEVLITVVCFLDSVHFSLLLIAFILRRNGKYKKKLANRKPKPSTLNTRSAMSSLTKKVRITCVIVKALPVITM